MYQPGDTVFLSDIGAFTAGSVDGAGLSLVCVTSNVNTQCCRRRDGGNVGEWHFPDGSIVPRNGRAPTGDFTRTAQNQQLRLNHRNNAVTPTGAFECRVPAESTGVTVVASIKITTNG